MVWEHLGLWCFSLWPGWAAANAVSMGRFAPTLMGHSGSSGYMEGGAGPGQSDEQSPVWDGWGTLRQLPGDAVTPPPPRDCDLACNRHEDASSKGQPLQGM